MSNYTKQISWSGKDALSDSDPEKVISGGDFDTEFSAVQTAINSKIDGGTITNFTSTGIDDNATSNAITIDASENVGIGTTSPAEKLHISEGQLGLQNGSASLITGKNHPLIYAVKGGGSGTFASYGSLILQARDSVLAAESNIIFNTGAGVTESARIQAGGGISFNGDTAAANALDDYETGTWTPGAGTVTTWTSPTWNAQYTKVGRVVTVSLKQTGGTFATGAVTYMTGLPFSTATSAVGSVSNGNVQDFGNCYINGSYIWFTTAVTSTTTLAITFSYTAT